MIQSQLLKNIEQPHLGDHNVRELSFKLKAADQAVHLQRKFHAVM